jgi:hypothetical protein
MDLRCFEGIYREDSCRALEPLPGLGSVSSCCCFDSLTMAVGCRARVGSRGRLVLASSPSGLLCGMVVGSVFG